MAKATNRQKNGSAEESKSRMMSVHLTAINQNCSLNNKGKMATLGNVKGSLWRRKNNKVEEIQAA